MTVTVHHGDCLDVLASLKADGAQFHACVTDPPYHLTSIVKRFGAENAAPAKHGTDGAFTRASRGFMGKQWDGGDIAFRPETWRAVYDVLRPGAHLLAFGGTRGFHRMACAIEDAGFEIRDCVSWLYGSGFPKSHDVSKAIDKAAGAEREVVRERYTVKRIKPGATVEREGAWGKQDIPYTATDTAPATPEAAQWTGWGTALKPAWEPIVVARKPLIGTVAANVLAHDTGALNIDASRIGEDKRINAPRALKDSSAALGGSWRSNAQPTTAEGRWPANVIHDGSDEVEAAFAAYGEKMSGSLTADQQKKGGFAGSKNCYGTAAGGGNGEFVANSGSASRFFYSAKATAEDRVGSKHPTVKPIALMRYLVKLVTAPGGIVLDPFAGSGSTGMACMAEGFDAVLIEREAEYVADIKRRLAHVRGDDTPLFSGAPDMFGDAA